MVSLTVYRDGEPQIGKVTSISAFKEELFTAFELDIELSHTEQKCTVILLS